MDRYVCTVCGHVSNPGIGEPLQDIRAGASFADLPKNRPCPVCFASKNQFNNKE
jgi:rubredoxin